MLNVWSVSGELILAVPLEDLNDAHGLKQRLSVVCGLPRFQLRLLCEGFSLDDDARLCSLSDVPVPL